MTADRDVSLAKESVVSVNDQLEVIGIQAAIELMGSRELLVEIAGMLLDELDEVMAQLDVEVGQQDLAAIARTAHRLKGNFGVVAAKEAHAAARELESAARDGDQSRTDAAVVALRAGVERLQPKLVELLDA
jgi:HPt (histidine-containing phosphotransfer) domain-containing protein